MPFTSRLDSATITSARVSTMLRWWLATSPTEFTNSNREQTPRFGIGLKTTEDLTPIVDTGSGHLRRCQRHRSFTQCAFSFQIEHKGQPWHCTTIVVGAPLRRPSP
jgi:hypothetical protein